MPNLDPELMGIFKRKIRNPLYFRHVCRIMGAYRAEDLACSSGAYGAIDQLSDALGVPVTSAQRENAAGWLMQCQVNPQFRTHRHAMWNLLNRY